MYRSRVRKPPKKKLPSIPWKYVGLGVLAVITLVVVVYALFFKEAMPMIPPEVFR